MTEQEFRAVYPMIFGWVQRSLADFASASRPVAAWGFRRLPSYYGNGILDRAKVVVVPKVPVPPLSAMGLSRFSDFERLDLSGITYLDTYFVRTEHARFESLHFHELVHVVQQMADNLIVVIFRSLHFHELVHVVQWRGF